MKINYQLTTESMIDYLPNARPLKEYKKGLVIEVNDLMQSNYSYRLARDYGDISDLDMEPDLSPSEMLAMGVFEGKYLNDCMDEFPREWFANALKQGKLSPEGADPSVNFFGIKSRQSLQIWLENGWIPQIERDPDVRGWFQWYCRAYVGRRIPELDKIQAKRWRAYKRHLGQVVKNCNIRDFSCRPKQRQGLLQWGYFP